MAALPTTDIFEFDRFHLDRRGLFRRDGNAVLAPVEIGSRALDVLRALLERPGDLVSRDEIMTAAWPGIAVEDNNLTIQIAALRRALDQDRANGSCIQTVPRRGYRFVTPVTRLEPATPVHVSSPSDGNGGSRDSHHALESGYPRQMSASVVVDPCLRGGDENLMRSGLLIRPRANLRNLVQGVSGRYRLWAGAVAVAIGALVLVAATGIWRIPWPWNLPAAPRLSIVVLPFTNLGGDPEQQYFADGITEDVTFDLSRIVDMFVISRNTAFTYRNQSVNIRQIGRELRVRYVLEGAVQRSADQVRVTAQLIDAEGGAHLWAERFDRDIGDLFTLQNEITRRIAVALGFELIAAENAKPAANPGAMDFILRGRAGHSKPPSRENFAQMVGEFERAVVLDPQSVVANSYLATTLLGRVLNGMSDANAADIERAEGHVSRALAISPRDPEAHLAKGFLLRAQNRVEEAIPEYEVAVASNRNWLLAVATLAWCKFQTGLIEDAIPLHEQAIRLSPRDNLLGVWYLRIGIVHLLQSRTDEAIPWLEKARNFDPRHPQPHPWLAAAYALKGDTERGAAELAEARRLTSDNRYSSIARLKASGYFGVPKIRALYEATYFVGLRQAGMPEE